MRVGVTAWRRAIGGRAEAVVAAPLAARVTACFVGVLRVGQGESSSIPDQDNC